AARHERQVRLLLVQAAYEQEVGEVDAAGRDADPDLSRFQGRRLHVVQHERFGRAELAADDGFHGAPLSTNMPSHSAMTAGFASPLISTTISEVARIRPGPFSRTSVSVMQARTSEFTLTGCGNRTRFNP